MSIAMARNPSRTSIVMATMGTICPDSVRIRREGRRGGSFDSHHGFGSHRTAPSEMPKMLSEYG